jgi:hypothetical protein
MSKTERDFLGLSAMLRSDNSSGDVPAKLIFDAEIK